MMNCELRMMNRAGFCEAGASTSTETAPNAMKTIIIVAMTPDRLIGAGGNIPWHEPADLRHFKRTTTGHAVIMGRKTHDSIGRPLPNRRNIVITRNRDYAPPGDAETSKRRNVEKSKLGRIDRGAPDAAQRCEPLTVVH